MQFMVSIQRLHFILPDFGSFAGRARKGIFYFWTELYCAICNFVAFVFRCLDMYFISADMCLIIRNSATATTVTVYSYHPYSSRDSLIIFLIF